jgi:predicted rRNA methylase YqxC with S4 and FtsJ domains
VPLIPLLNRRFPGLDDPALLIKQGAVLVNGVPAASPRTRVRADPRVVSLERTNLARLGPYLITEPASLLTMDLS